MKKTKILLSILTLMLFSTFLARATAPSILGKWYGLKDGSPVTVVFNKDQTMSIQTDAFSSLSFTGSYKIDSTVHPVAVDVTIPGGMVCAAIINFSGDGRLEFFGFFGAPGQTQRPAMINANPKRPDALYLNLSRNAKDIEQKPSAVSSTMAAKLSFERNKRLGRGINLNGLLDNNSGDFHLYKTADQPIKPEYIGTIAKAGFNSVRLPVTWSAHCSKNPPYTIAPAFFSRVDKVVNLCLKNGLAVSIDMHYYPYINMGPDSSISFDDNIKRFYALWEQIAQHYKEYPPTVYFDILNEPNMEMDASFYNDLVLKSVKLIRKTNPGRTILIGTPELGQSWTIGLLDLPKDDWNLIVEVHYYMPFLFTHQGLAYAHAEAGIGTQWAGTAEEKKPLDSDLGFCAKWSKAHFRPINLGEFGAIERADMASRARYIGFIREEADKYGFSCHIWGFREIFRIFDEESGKWQQPILDALIPQKQ
ncbi:MAG: glycoside hydrolase family 5 protein [Chitinophagaceae bacterium]